jgi:cysteinyl-tRNA synthetase
VSLDWREKFLAAINDDLNLPKALAVVSSVLKSKLSAPDKLATILDFDQVLGLSLNKAGVSASAVIEIDQLPAGIQELIKRRQTAREQKDWSTADRLREEIERQGYLVEDTKNGQEVKRINKYWIISQGDN